MGSNWLIGVGLAALASIAGNVGLNLQKLAHNRIALKAAETGAKKGSYVSHPWWIVGLVLQIVCGICDFAALGFTPQIIVAPLGSLTLVVNVLVAPFLLGEHVRRRELAATAIIISGSVLAVIFATHESSVVSPDEIYALFGETRFIFYAAVTTVFMGLCWLGVRQINLLEEEYDIQSATYRRWAKYHRFLYAALSGTMGAQNVLFSKVSAELLISWFAGNQILLARWEGWLVVVCLACTIFFQLKWLNAGLRRFDALYIIPVFQSFWIVMSVVSGMIFFGEYEDLSMQQLLLFTIGVLVTVFGVLHLSGRSVNIFNEDVELKSESAERPLLSSLVDSPDFSPTAAHSRILDDESDDDESGVIFPSLQTTLDAWLGKGHQDIPMSTGFSTMAATLHLARKRSASGLVDAETGRLLDSLLQGYDMNMFETDSDVSRAVGDFQGEVTPNEREKSSTGSRSRVKWARASIFEAVENDPDRSMTKPRIDIPIGSRSGGSRTSTPRSPCELPRVPSSVDLLRGSSPVADADNHSGATLELSPHYPAASSSNGGSQTSISVAHVPSSSVSTAAPPNPRNIRDDEVSISTPSTGLNDMLSRQPEPAFAHALAESLPNASMDSIMSAVSELGEIESSLSLGALKHRAKSHSSSESEFESKGDGGLRQMTFQPRAPPLTHVLARILPGASTRRKYRIV